MTTTMMMKVILCNMGVALLTALFIIKKNFVSTIMTGTLMTIMIVCRVGGALLTLAAPAAKAHVCPQLSENLRKFQPSAF